MISLELQEIAALCGGELINGVPDTRFDTVSTDTRSLSGGELFVALSGENFDAHNFLDVAVKGGAGALLVSQVPEEDLGCAIIRVGDTLEGLQQLAHGVRRKMEIQVCGITGSSGKTSTKDMVKAVLSTGFPTMATAGNLNNHIGLPLTVLAADATHRWGVWELGMSNPGEIAPLAKIAAPDIGIVTNVGVAHIEFMKTREAIAEEKGELLAALSADGCGIIPHGDDFADALAARCAGEVLRCGIDSGDVVATGVTPTETGSKFSLHLPGGESVEVALGIPGEHMVRNALLAAAAGWKAGLCGEQIAAGLASVHLTGGRLQMRELAGGARLLDDSYNANPESVEAALQTIMTIPVQAGGRRLAVLGRMAELGDVAEQEHRAIGASAVTCGVDALFTVGDEANWIWEAAATASEGTMQGGHFADHASCGDALKNFLSPNDVVLLKGSRSAAMEKVLNVF